ncbi:MAG: adenylate kinase [Acidithiobacillus sp.]|uniref:adenylate kinase n=1 Tax=Acidithiobacillus sp. TaxID=1872118 RepID=UPI0025BF094C|nr:adenylate kinase [Acidithiobacillus sp.]
MTERGHIIFLGAPGVGKGTQAKLLSRRLGLPHVSTGDMLRASVLAGTEMGRRAKAVMDSGALVGDDIILGIVRERLAESDASSGVLFDGFPRTLAQAKALDAMLAESPLGIRAVLHLVLADEEIVERLSGRRVCAQCGAIYHVRFQPPKQEGVCDRCGGALLQRDDDRPEVIRHRLEVYRRDTEPLIAYYADRPGYREISAEGDTETVSKRILEEVGEAHG